MYALARMLVKIKNNVNTNNSQLLKIVSECDELFSKNEVSELTDSGLNLQKSPPANAQTGIGPLLQRKGLDPDNAVAAHMSVRCVSPCGRFPRYCRLRGSTISE